MDVHVVGTALKSDHVTGVGGATLRSRHAVAVQVSFAFSSPLVWDKAPNSFGQKAVVVDPTGVAIKEEEDWLVTAASIGSHLLRLAVAQRIIDYDDLEGCAIGEVFKLSDLIKKRGNVPVAANAPHPRYTPTVTQVDDMCVLPLQMNSAPMSPRMYG